MTLSTKPSQPADDSKPWRKSLKLLAWPIGCYLATIALLMVFENRLIFFPCPATADWQLPPAQVVVEDIWLPTDHGRVHAWWIPHPAARGSLIYFHGNAGNLSHCAGSATRLGRALGESVLLIDYPGYGKSEGEPTEPGCHAAAAAAYDWLTRIQKVSPGQITLFGNSLGAAVAAELASRRPHRALVLVRAFTSAPDMAQHLYPFLPARWLTRSRLDTLGRIESCSGRVFVAHGDRDGTVPCSHGRQLFDAAHEPKRFHLMPGCDHNDPLPPEFFTTLADFLHPADEADARNRLP